MWVFLLKKTNDYLLTIGIPTWNRKEFLNNLLDVLIKQVIDSKRDNIEILVSDNHSTDGTMRFMQKLVKEYSFVSYYRNSSNLGCKKNDIELIKKCKGDFLWFMGDDDSVVGNGLISVLGVLEDSGKNNIWLLNSTPSQYSFKFNSKGLYKINILNKSVQPIFQEMGLLSNFIIPSKQAKSIIRRYPSSRISPAWPHLHVTFLIHLQENVPITLYLKGITKRGYVHNNLVYVGCDVFKVRVEHKYLFLKELEKQTNRKMSYPLRGIFSLPVIAHYIINNTFTGSYSENLNYFFNLFRTKSIILIISFLPLLLPFSLRKFLIWSASLLFKNHKFYASLKERNIQYKNLLNEKKKEVRSLSDKQNWME